jgi:hypothetical protein
MAYGNRLRGCSIVPARAPVAATARPMPARSRPWRLTEVHVIGQVPDVGRWLEREVDGELRTHSLEAADEAVCELTVAKAPRSVGDYLPAEDLPASGVAPPRTLACPALGLNGVVLKRYVDAAGKVVDQMEARINANRNPLLSLKQQAAPAGAADTETTPPTPKPVGASVRA